MSRKTKDSRVRIAFNRKARAEELKNRQPLWEQRGNNPPNLIGYLDATTRDIFTAKGTLSANMRPTPDGWGYREGNSIHDRRVAAASREDFTHHV